MPESGKRVRKQILVSFFLPCQSGSGKSVGQTKCCTVIESGELVRYEKKKKWDGSGVGNLGREKGRDQTSSSGRGKDIIVCAV